MTANQMLEMIVEQSVQELEKIENIEELHKHQDKFTFEEYEQLELAILLKMSNMNITSYFNGKSTFIASTIISHSPRSFPANL